MDSNNTPAAPLAGSTVTVFPTQHVRPGAVIVIINGAVAYEGIINETPAELIGKPGALVLMHPHLKAQLDAKVAKETRKFKRVVRAAPELAAPYASTPQPENPYADFSAKAQREIADRTGLTDALQQTRKQPQ